MDDWRLGRLIRSKITAATIVAAGTLSVNANMQRVGIRCSIATSQIVVPGGVTITIDGQLAVILFSSFPTIDFTFADDGELPTKSFLLTNNTSATNMAVSIIEYFLPEEYIQAGIDSFKSQYKFGGL
jgi:hypothetical protein